MKKLTASVLLIICFLFRQTVTAQNINTVAGGIGTTGMGTTVGLGDPYAIATDTSGNFYVTDDGYNVIRKITPAGIVSTFAGNGTKGSTGNGGPATMAALNYPRGIATDHFGNVYISETGTHTIRKIDHTGTITLYAGTGVSGYGGDGGPATSAMLAKPMGLATDNAGNLYVADLTNNRIRKVSTAGTITSIAGTGAPSFSGDGFSAALADLYKPISIAIDGSGNLFFIDQGNQRVRKIDNAGIISTIAGNGGTGTALDGIPATAATFTNPTGICIDGSGAVYVADDLFKIRYIDGSGLIQTFAGGGILPLDGIDADSASLFYPSGISFNRLGNLGIAMSADKRVRLVNTAHIINTIAGNNTNCIAGDGGQATDAQTIYCMGVAVDLHGNMYVSDAANSVIRKISNTGIISTYAGTGSPGYSGDHNLAISAKLFQPKGLAVDTAGNLFVADYGNRRVRKISTFGIITTVAGDGSISTPVNEVPATTTCVPNPTNVHVDAHGNLYICDRGVNALRMVDNSGIIHNLAGCYLASFSGDGGPATASCVNVPTGVCTDAVGNIYFGDVNNARIRVIDPSGTINTFAGTGTAGYSGDGGPATAAELNEPSDLTAGPDGSIYFTDIQNNVVRKIAPDHTISTVVGNILAGFSGDGGPASAAQLSQPMGLSFDPWGNYYIADWQNNRIRKVGNNVPSEVKQIADEKKLVIYPNPGCDKFTFYFPATTDDQVLISIMDINGRTVFSTRGATNKEITATIEEPTGVYIVSATTTTGKYYQKLLIKK